ncbi:ORF6N domain-containing protein [Lachnospiraceae bacterium ASD3451]|uniref:ORF6N domain-containing protein n=1 Tax=Diplocloster agilis TaxID=2850323 RepID=UPI001DC24974|nr:ORF6N domain-containing protein [Diplocloster agilis]MBU9743202.1 ORF6N domain-containing protein [Diplocloster agilis]
MDEPRNHLNTEKENSINNLKNMNQSTIQNLVYVIRGQQVMMDCDLAKLYQVETRVLNQAVKRNISRFPESFRFQITSREYEDLKSQFVISSSDNGADNYGGRRTLPYVFTEQGIAMLSAVLKSPTAIQVSIRIMETFVEIRRYMVSSTWMLDKINRLELCQMDYQRRTDKQIEQILDFIADHAEVTQRVFFEGQIYCSRSKFLSKLLKTFDKTFREIFPVFISTKRREKPSAFFDNNFVNNAYFSEAASSSSSHLASSSSKAPISSRMTCLCLWSS